MGVCSRAMSFSEKMALKITFFHIHLLIFFIITIGTSVFLQFCDLYLNNNINNNGYF